VRKGSDIVSIWQVQQALTKNVREILYDFSAHRLRGGEESLTAKLYGIR